MKCSFGYCSIPSCYCLQHESSHITIHRHITLTRMTGKRMQSTNGVRYPYLINTFMSGVRFNSHIAIRIASLLTNDSNSKIETPCVVGHVRVVSNLSSFFSRVCAEGTVVSDQCFDGSTPVADRRASSRSLEIYFFKNYC